MMLWDRLTSPGTLSRDTWQWDGNRFRRRIYADAIAEARHVAAGLRKRGVSRGSVVATVITNGPDAISCVAGAWFAGTQVASLPIISRGMTVARYTTQLRDLCKFLDAECLVVEDRFLAFMPTKTDLGVDVVGCRSLVETASLAEISPPPLDKTMFIQFSSGTTSEPRGVELTGAAIDAQLAALSAHAAIDPERDVGYSWLPMSHDMGFFGCALLAWYSGIPGVMATPERFLGAPRTWFDDCARFGATVTAAPPFALDVAARAERVRSSGKPLELRICMIGAEEILWPTLTNAVDAFAPRGLTSECLTPGYGLAEATLGVTGERVDAAPSFIDVDSAALADGRVEVVEPDHPDARRLVSAGEPVPGVDVSIDAADSEILVESPSLASRYFGNEKLTAERFGDGKLRTGDIGFLHEGSLFISGRNDDLLIVGGRNIYVHEIERILSTDADVKSGNCAIVDIHDQVPPRVALVAEANPRQVDAEELAARLHRRTMESSGLSIHDFVFLDQGVFPKTPSGKAQRYRCRELAADPTIGTRVTLGVGAQR
jgi:acyl-CoA synthetase (AMP-forming)/AMP-acid ligase II